VAADGSRLPTKTRRRSLSAAAAKAAGDAMLPPVVDRDSATAGRRSRIRRGSAVVDGGWNPRRGKLAIFLNDGRKGREAGDGWSTVLGCHSSNGTDFTGPNPIATWSFSYYGICCPWYLVSGKKGQTVPVPQVVPFEIFRPGKIQPNPPRGK
ncbi:hypothetical protein THAOC_12785, partial [Thalassiosira oceanica]